MTKVLLRRTRFSPLSVMQDHFCRRIRILWTWLASFMWRHRAAAEANYRVVWEEIPWGSFLVKVRVIQENFCNRNPIRANLRLIPNLNARIRSFLVGKPLTYLRGFSAWLSLLNSSIILRILLLLLSLRLPPRPFATVLP